MKRFWPLFFLIQFHFFSFAQNNIPIGSWRVHSPYRYSNCVEFVYNRIYVGGEKGLFYYDLVGNNLQTFTKIDGLHESNVTAMRYDSTNKQLLVAYSSGAIDILSENEIFYFTDIRRSPILGTKSISHIDIHKKNAYISTGVGLIVFDLAKREIKESYSNLSADGALTAIKSSTVFRDTLFAISNKGLICTSLKSSANKMDFSNWKSFGLNDSLSTAIGQIASNSKHLFAAANKEFIYRYSNGKWTKFLDIKKSSDALRRMTSTSNRTLVSFGSLMLSIDDNLNIDSLYKSEWANLNDMVFNPKNSNQIYVADYGNGLVVIDYNKVSILIPSSPYAKDAFRVKYANDKMYLLAGAYYANIQATGRYQPVCIFDNFNWTYKDFVSRDIVSAAYNPINGNLYFTSIKSAGIIVSKPDNSFQYLNDLTPGSTLIDPVAPGAGYLALTDVAVDSKGVVWVTHASESALRPILHSIDLSGNWKSYSIITSDLQSYASKVLIDDLGNKWVRLGARDQQLSGLLVFNEKRAAGQQVRNLTTEKGGGNLPDINVRCMEKDTNGEIWIGTAKGVAVFYNPASIFASQGFDAGRPIYNSRPLLNDQDILDIKIDGGNRKWIATNDGVWLFSADGSEFIHHFTSENSPLPSNQVIDIDINDKTGEVFFVTNGGVASYRERATSPEPTMPNITGVEVYPNPIQPSYSGEVAIRGLTFQSSVKITDINGRLVYQTASLGGTATWNLQTTSGAKAKAGIYMVFCISLDGNEQLVSKLAVLD